MPKTYLLTDEEIDYIFSDYDQFELTPVEELDKMYVEETARLNAVSSSKLSE